MAQSKRTGGPKTQAGKMASAKNAIKTGAYSSLIILPGESENDFKQMEDQFFHDFRPEDGVAATMVKNLAVLTWKRLRAQKIEHSGLVRVLATKFDITDFLRVSFPVDVSNPGPVLTVVEAMTEAVEDELRVAFSYCDQFILAIPNAQELQLMRQQSPLLYEYLESKASSEIKNCRFWPSTNVTNRRGEVSPFIKYHCETFLSDNDIPVIAVKHAVKLREIIKEIKEARLLKFIQESSIQRVHDDLDRAFYRTLSELRKHQHWRQERNTVDVTSED
jgi:hypothetical protein